MPSSSTTHTLIETDCSSCGRTILLLAVRSEVEDFLSGIPASEAFPGLTPLQVEMIERRICPDCLHKAKLSLN